MKKLNEAKEAALGAYRIAKMAWMETVSKGNLKGDFEKWKILCDAKADCMRLGVRI